MSVDQISGVRPFCHPDTAADLALLTPVYLLTVLPSGCHLQGRDKAWSFSAFRSQSLPGAGFCKHGLSLNHFGEVPEIQGGARGKSQDLLPPWSISQEQESALDLETPWVWLPRHAVPG